MERIIGELERRGFAVTFFDTAAEARSYLLQALESADSVGIGGSVSVQQLDIVDTLMARGTTVHWHWLPDRGGEDPRRLALFADAYLCSPNAVTEDGKLLFIDGSGNRVAAVCYGPKKVYLICGVNKLSGNDEEALRRAKEQAAAPNARRLGVKTPCSVTDKCVDCLYSGRLCRAVLTLERCPNSHPVEILLVNEPLGY